MFAAHQASEGNRLLDNSCALDCAHDPDIFSDTTRSKLECSLVWWCGRRICARRLTNTPHDCTQLPHGTMFTRQSTVDIPSGHAHVAEPQAKPVPQNDVPSMLSMPKTPFTPLMPFSSAPTPKLDDIDLFNTDHLSESCAWSEGSCSARGTELAWKDGQYVSVVDIAVRVEQEEVRPRTGEE